MSHNTRPAPASFSEQQLHTLFELISDGIWDWNANTGYVYRNPGWYAMLGYASHSMANSVLTWESVIHPEDRVPMSLPGWQLPVGRRQRLHHRPQQRRLGGAHARRPPQHRCRQAAGGAA